MKYRDLKITFSIENIDFVFRYTQFSLFAAVAESAINTSSV